MIENLKKKKYVFNSDMLKILSLNKKKALKKTDYSGQYAAAAATAIIFIEGFQSFIMSAASATPTILMDKSD